MDSYRRKLAAEARDARESAQHEAWLLLIMVAIIMLSFSMGWCS
jgi:hypothetical protein